MTDSYNQDSINLREATPISIQNVDVTPIVFQLGAIGNGDTLVVNFWGGGSQADGTLITLNHYLIETFVGIFTRVADVGNVDSTITLVNAVGAVPALSLTFDDGPVSTLCRLTITGPATPFNNRLQFSAVQF